MTHVNFKFFAASILFFVFGALTLNPLYAAPESPESAEKVCVLPSPDFLLVTEIGTTWYRAVWASVPGAAAYEITSIDVNTGQVLNVTTVPGNINTKDISGFAPGTVLSPQIRTIDAFGVKSDPPTIGPNTGIIVIDLVTNSYTIPRNIYQQGSCEVGMSPGTGCVVPNTGARMFVITRNSGGEYAFFFAFVDHNGGTHIKIQEAEIQNGDSNLYEFDGENGASVAIYYDFAQFAGRLTAIVSPTEKKIYRAWEGNSPAPFTIRDITNAPEHPGSGGNGRLGRSELDQVIHFGKLAVTPNPFNQLVKVQIPFAIENAEMTISLFDISGQMVMKQEYPVGMPILDLNLELMPAGMYLLRVETGGRVDTVKIIKAQ